MAAYLVKPRTIEFRVYDQAGKVQLTYFPWPFGELPSQGFEIEIMIKGKWIATVVTHRGLSLRNGFWITVGVDENGEDPTNYKGGGQ